DALVGYRKSHEVRSQQQHLTDAAEDATKLSDMRYRGGAASYLEVLDSETRAFSARLALAQAQLRELQSLVQIYRSLGGGWQQCPAAALPVTAGIRQTPADNPVVTPT